MTAAPAAADTLWLRALPSVFVLIWSTGFVVAKFGLPFAPPLTFLAIRYALSIACFLLWVRWARAVWPQGASQWLHLGVTGVLMHAGYLGGVWVAVKAGMGSGLVALIVGLQPVLTAVWVSRMSVRQGQGADAASDSSGVSRLQWLGLALGLGGLLLVVWRKLGVGSEVTTLTLLAAVFALLSITVGTLYQKRYVQPTDVRTANTVQLMAALAVTLPLTLIESEAIAWTPSFVAAMAWSVFVLTLGGSSLLYMLIQRGAATAVTSLLYLVPPTTALMAWLLFEEPVTAATWLGTALTAVGVALVVRPARRVATKPVA